MKRTGGFARRMTACAAMCAALAGGPASAQEQDGTDRLDRIFGTIDRDGSGTLTVREMHDAAGARFRALDLDGDGTVHAQENRASRLKLVFERADRDANGRLDEVEVAEVAKERALRRFARLDSDRDGMLSLEELQRMRPAQDVAPASDGMRMTLAQLEVRMMTVFRQADADGDGIVTLDEATAGAGR